MADSTLQRIAQRAMTARGLRSGFFSNFSSRPLSRVDIVRGSLLHAAYWVSDRSYRQGGGVSGGTGNKAWRFAVLGPGNLPPIFSMAGGIKGVGGGRGSVPDLVKTVADKIFPLIAVNKQSTYSFATIIERYAMDFRDEIEKGDSPGLTPELLRAALEVLSREKRIIVKEDGVQYYDQVSMLLGAAQALHGRLREQTMLHGLARALRESTRGIFGHVDFYLIDNGEMRIIAGDAAAVARSSYSEWRRPPDGSIFESMLAGGGTRLEYVANIRKDGRIPTSDVRKYEDHFEHVGEAIYCVCPLGDWRGAVAFKMHEWDTSRSLYSRNTDVRARDVNEVISLLARRVAEEVRRVAANQPDISIREMWETEESIASTPRDKVAVMPVQIKNIGEDSNILVKFLRARKKHGVRIVEIERMGRKFLDITIDKPAQILGQEMERLMRVFGFIWSGLPADFVRTVVLRSTRVKLKVEVSQGRREPVGYNITTQRPEGHGSYYEIFAVHPTAQRLGFSTRDIYAFVKESLIEEAARIIIPKFRFFKTLRFWWSFTLAYLYARGWVKKPPRIFENIRAKVCFLTDTSVALEPFSRIIGRISPNANHPNPTVSGEQYETSSDKIKAVLPDGYEPVRVTVGGTSAYVVRSHEARQPHDQSPKYPNADSERFFDAIRTPEGLGLPEGNYDLVVFMEIGIDDFRRYFQKKNNHGQVEGASRKMLDKVASF